MAEAEVWAFAGAALAAIVVGMLVSALINALADRVVGVDEPIWSATHCRACLAPLPAASPLALAEFKRRRVCEKCGKPASLRRALVQVALPLAFLALVARASFALQWNSSRVALPGWEFVTLGAVLFTALAFVFVVDLEHRLIYDLSIWPPLLLILLIAGTHSVKSLPSLVLSGVIAGGLFLIFYGLGWLIYREEALGFGDVKLAALMGVASGWPGVLTALGITMVCGFVAAALLLAVDTSSRRSFIPFGVFMVIGVVGAVLVGPIPW
jgi:prepilin signal peptidase PulO-like enzyme (type II secretory pathway)